MKRNKAKASNTTSLRSHIFKKTKLRAWKYSRESATWEPITIPEFDRATDINIYRQRFRPEQGQRTCVRAGSRCIWVLTYLADHPKRWFS